jgi:small-conductance mechanosensitive channel
VEKVIVTALAANELVLTEPAPSAVVAELQDHAVVMRARAHVRSQDYWRALWSLQKEVKTALDKASILPAVPRQAAMTRIEPCVTGNALPEEEPQKGRRGPRDNAA